MKLLFTLSMTIACLGLNNLYSQGQNELDYSNLKKPYKKLSKLLKEGKNHKFIKILTTQLETEKDKRYRFFAYHNIGIQYFNLEEFSKAHDFYLKALSLKDHGRKKPLVNLYDDLARINYKKCSDLIEKNSSCNEKVNEYLKTANFYINEGLHLDSKNKYLLKLRKHKINYYCLKKGFKDAVDCYSSIGSDCDEFLDKIKKNGDWENFIKENRYTNRQLNSAISDWYIKKHDNEFFRHNHFKSDSFSEVKSYIRKIKSTYKPVEIEFLCSNQWISVNESSKMQESFVKVNHETKQKYLISEEEKTTKIIQNVNASGIRLSIENFLFIKIPNRNCEFVGNGEIYSTESVNDLTVSKNQYLPIEFRCSNLDLDEIRKITDFLVTEFPLTYKEKIVDYSKIFKKNNYDSNNRKITIEAYVGGHQINGFKYLMDNVMGNLTISENSLKSISVYKITKKGEWKSAGFLDGRKVKMIWYRKEGTNYEETIEIYRLENGKFTSGTGYSTAKDGITSKHQYPSEATCIGEVIKKRL